MSNVTVQVSPSASDAAVAKIQERLAWESQFSPDWQGDTFQIVRADPTCLVGYENVAATVLTHRIERLIEALS